jgi:hypothetical protein
MIWDMAQVLCKALPELLWHGSGFVQDVAWTALIRLRFCARRWLDCFDMAQILCKTLPELLSYGSGFVQDVVWTALIWLRFCARRCLNCFDMAQILCKTLAGLLWYGSDFVQDVAWTALIWLRFCARRCLNCFDMAQVLCKTLPELHPDGLGDPCSLLSGRYRRSIHEGNRIESWNWPPIPKLRISGAIPASPPAFMAHTGTRHSQECSGSNAQTERSNGILGGVETRQWGVR